MYSNNETISSCLSLPPSQEHHIIQQAFFKLWTKRTASNLSMKMQKSPQFEGLKAGDATRMQLRTSKNSALHFVVEILRPKIKTANAAVERIFSLKEK